ncbi:MAG: deoxyguanosinetriphosphate triphosphohydrolase [Planctomycetota bacterium]|nr:deoxyguanosinetriphosphate triphosphohydrolase [Planctomycetota bacterium]
MLPAAQRAAYSRGRRHPEPDHPRRGQFERDRDRIIHSAAFRRLEYKTQVFVNGEGDNYRTRLTHTLEVAQLARSIARGLRLNEDLAEAAALSHDLGHTPFGHAGERELDEILVGKGGFNHNRQGLRVVDILEKRYAAFDGLNLCYEVREAFVRHGGPIVAGTQDEFPPGDAPLLEVAAGIAADDIAYLAHDIDDGLFSGMLEFEALAEEALWRRVASQVDFSNFPPSLRRAEGVRRLINLLVTDLLETTEQNIIRLELDSPAMVRAAGEGAVAFSQKAEEQRKSLQDFLFRNLYRHPEVTAIMEAARDKLRQLFSRYAGDPGTLPEEYRAIAARDGAYRAAADYVAGMTDRFAGEEWEKHFFSGKNTKK